MSYLRYRPAMRASMSNEQFVPLHEKLSCRNSGLVLNDGCVHASESVVPRHQCVTLVAKELFHCHLHGRKILFSNFPFRESNNNDTMVPMIRTIDCSTQK